MKFEIINFKNKEIEVNIINNNFAFVFFNY